MTINSINGFGIIADDLTGAMDAGAGFLRACLHPFVKLNSTSRTDSFVTVISTDSRELDPDAAYRTARRRARELSGLCVFKKIDSTLRGNVGTEIMGVMDALKSEKAIICPAFPANRRTVSGGQLMVGNIPARRTSFAGDPVYPVKESDIPALIQQQTCLPIGLITLGEVDRGADNVFRKIHECNEKIIVVDAVEEIHLRNIAQALALSGCSWLPCGSGGLAGELPAAFGYKQADEIPFKLTPGMKPVLAVAGSHNSATMEQVKIAEASPSIRVIHIEPEVFFDGRGRLVGLSKLKNEAADSINRGKSVVITTTFSRYVPALKQACARLLARVAAATMRKCELSGLFLTGGDIARETCRVLGITGIRILKEIEPGVILGDAIGAPGGNVRIVTKAGGFGSDRTMVDAIHYLRGEEG